MSKPKHNCNPWPMALAKKKEKLNFWMGCTVVWWLTLSPHSKRVLGSNPSWSLPVGSLHFPSVYMWVLSGYSGFLPLPKNMHVRLIDDYTLFLGVRERGWLFVSFVSMWPSNGLPLAQ